jgi:hypothetical protein
MLFRETVAVYCENHTEHTDTVCGQNAEFWYVKAGGTYSNHWAGGYALQSFAPCLISKNLSCINKTNYNSRMMH